MTTERQDTWAAGKLYEPYVGRWSRLVASDFLVRLDAPRELEWLDVGCGTGALSQVILQQAHPRSVRGVDPSAGFVGHAKAHVADPRATFPDALTALWVQAGLQDVQLRPIEVPTRFRDFDDYWAPFLGGQGPAPGYAMSLSEERRGALRERIRAGLPVAADGSIELIARAWAVRGRSTRT